METKLATRAGVAFLATTIGVAAALSASDSLSRAQALFEEHRYSQARSVLEPTIGGDSSPGARLWLARICNRLDDWECGLEHAEPAIEGLPDSSAAHFEYALAVRIKMSNVGKMKAMMSLGGYKRALAKSLELDPRNVDAHEEQIGYLINAPGFAGRDRDEARSRIGDLQQLDWKAGMRMLAALEDAEGNADEARRTLQKVIERHPEDASARVQMGFWFLEQESWPEADEQFAAVPAASEPRHRYSALYQRGRLRVLGRFEAERAVAFFDEFVASVDGGMDIPSPSDAYWRQGLAHEQLAQPDAARGSYRNALRLDPAHKEAKKALGKLAD